MSRYETHHALIQAFICTDQMHRRLFERQMAKIGVHRSQHRILMYLAANRDKELSQKDIAETFDISPAAITVTLKKLESGGYITRKAHRYDNRVNTVSVTEKALSVVETTKRFSEDLEEVVFAGFSDDELNTFSTLLNKMQSAMLSYEGKLPTEALKGEESHETMA